MTKETKRSDRGLDACEPGGFDPAVTEAPGTQWVPIDAEESFRYAPAFAQLHKYFCSAYIDQDGVSYWALLVLEGKTYRLIGNAEVRDYELSQFDFSEPASYLEDCVCTLDATAWERLNELTEDCYTDIPTIVGNIACFIYGNSPWDVDRLPPKDSP